MEEDRVAKVALEEVKEAVKRKLEEREELIKLKRLRMSVQLAYEAMDEVAPLVDGAGTVSAGSVGGGRVADSSSQDGAQPSGIDVVAAFERFETAVLTAREKLTELTLHQQQLDEN